jgi:hypothetical protein
LVTAQVAQLVEQRIENPRVAGSIPALGTKWVRLGQRSSAAPLRSTRVVVHRSRAFSGAAQSAYPIVW